MHTIDHEPSPLRPDIRRPDIRRPALRRPALRWLARAAACVGAFALAACGNLTAGGYSEVNVAVSGDAEDPAPAQSSSRPEPAPAAASTTSVPPAMTAPSILPAQASGGGPEGEVRVELALYLVAEDGTETLLDENVRVRVDLAGREDVDAVRRRRVTPSTYTALHMIFFEIEARVDSGLPVLGEIRVDIDDASIDVSRPIDLVLEQGDSADLLIDLNAAAWLQAVDPITKLVDPTEFATLISVE